MTLKAYKCSDCDWYAAESAEQAAELWAADTGEPCDDGYPQEVSDAEMDEQVPAFDEDERPTGEMTSMREMLAEQAGPGWLCGTEG